MAIDSKGDALPRIEQVLTRNPATFSTHILDMWAGANDHIGFRYERPPADRRVSRIEEKGRTFIVVPAEPTLGDLLSASRLVDTRLIHNERSPLEVFAKNLTDSAILISRQPAFAGAEFDPVVELIFQLGISLSAGAQSMEASIQPSRRDIQSLRVEPPQGADQQAYENGLYLFLLGKNAVLSKPEKDGPLQSDAQHTFYTALYDRWKRRQPSGRLNIAVVDEEIQSKKKFDEWLISRRLNISRFLGVYILASLSGGRGSRSLNELTEQAIEAHLDKKISQRGREVVETELKGHKHSEDMEFRVESSLRDVFLDQLRDQIHEINIKFFRDGMSRQDVDQAISDLYNRKLEESALFEITGLMLKNHLERHGRMNPEQKIKFLWDIVQAYDYKIAGVPQKAVEMEEFECNLRASILGQLVEKFFPEDFVVLGDWIKSHMRLIVIDKKDIYPHRLPKAYFVDPTRPRYSREGGDRTWLRDYNSIKEISDRELLQDIMRAYYQNPDHVLVHSSGEGPDWTARNREFNHSIGNYRNLTEAGMWTHAAHIYQLSEEDRAYCWKKAVELVPISGDAWLGLANSTNNQKEKSEYLKKAAELNPHDSSTWYELARSYDYLRYPWQFREVSPLQIIEFWQKFLRVQNHWSNNYNQSHRFLAEERIRELQDLEKSRSSIRSRMKYRIKRATEIILEGR